MKVWHIGDTHSFHGLLKIEEEVDLVIHSGDFSNYHDAYRNEPEAKDFLHWFANLDIKYKVLIAGNHDAYAAICNDEFKQICKDLNIIYLENSDVVIEGVKIWGSPHCPTFGNWHFMKARHNLYKVWNKIPEDTDILVTHTPPKRILDLSYNRNHEVDFCGCNSLNTAVRLIEPKFHLFGHIHNNADIINAGKRVLPNTETIFFNGSVVTDGKFGKLSSNGNIFYI